MTTAIGPEDPYTPPTDPEAERIARGGYNPADFAPLPEGWEYLEDSAGYLPCGCHGSQREHSCKDEKR